MLHPHPHPHTRFAKYARSKLANVCFTLELQRRLEPRGITAYSTSPGPVNTSLFRDFPWYTQVGLPGDPGMRGGGGAAQHAIHESCSGRLAWQPMYLLVLFYG